MLSPRNAFICVVATGALLSGCGDNEQSNGEVPPFIPFENREDEIHRLVELRDIARLSLAESQIFYEETLSAIPDAGCEAAVRSFTPPSGAHRNQSLEVVDQLLAITCDSADAEIVEDLRDYYFGTITVRQTLLNNVEESLAENVAAQIEDDRLK